MIQCRIKILCGKTQLFPILSPLGQGRENLGTRFVLLTSHVALTLPRMGWVAAWRGVMYGLTPYENMPCVITKLSSILETRLLREVSIFVPTGRARFAAVGKHQESRPLRKSNFLSTRRVIVLYSQPIRFVRLDSEHAQSESMNLLVRESTFHWAR